MSEKQSPAKRPRAPTITIDTSPTAGQTTQGSSHQSPSMPIPRNANSRKESEITSPSPDNPNALSVPTLRSRGDSVNSQASQSTIGTAGSNTLAGSQHGYPSDNSNNTELPDEEVFKPESDQEAELFKVTETPFGITPGHLSKLLPRKSIQALILLHGPEGLSRLLRTSLTHGLDSQEQKLTGKVELKDVDDIAIDSAAPTQSANQLDQKESLSESPTGTSPDAFSDRKRIFGDNHLPEKKTKSFFQLAFIAFQDKIILLLAAAAVVSLALGIYTSKTKPAGEGARIDWVEGVAIIIAVFIVVITGATVDWRKEKQFAKLNKRKEDRTVKVIRSGKLQSVSVYDIYPGDLLNVEPGDLIPVDGIYIQGSGVTCDESSATGESDIVKKTPASEVMKAYAQGRYTQKMDPFMIAGAQVGEGIGTFLCTAVGKNSSHGKTTMSLQEGTPPTPLQERLDKLAGGIARFGLASAALLFVILMIKFGIFFHGPSPTDPTQEKNPSDHGQEFINIFILCVTIIVVAVPEGLPLAVTLALAFATRRMFKDNNLVRHLKSCETMGNATVICSDKTGTLTQNVMTVVTGSLGRGTLKFAEGGHLTSSKEVEKPQSSKDSTSSQIGHTIALSSLHDETPKELQQLLKEAIVMNSTVYEEDKEGKTILVGSKTETALLELAQKALGLGHVKTERDSIPQVQIFPFDSGKKCMGVVIKSGDKYFLHIKGAAEIVLSKCSHVVKEPTSSLEAAALSDEDRRGLRNVTSDYASRSLRTIGIAYREFSSWPPQDARRMEDNPNHVEFEDLFKGLTWLGVVGIQDPVRDGVPEAIAKCERAGVRIIMVTGDNLETARAIAKECGILKEDGIVLDGPSFRRLPELELGVTAAKICVLARSSPEDKKVLVSTLQELNNIVAVTGDGTNDAQALKTADVGFSMGIAGTEVAKESSDIVLLDDNFSSIVKALAWGRCINDAVKKFLQFQFTVNVTAVLLTFGSAIPSGWFHRGSDTSAGIDAEASVINAVQLLWVNLIMDSFAALALATDSPDDRVFNKKPEPRGLPLINHTMWKMIWVQFFFQSVMTLGLYFAGPYLPMIKDWDETTQDTLIFNVFVWAQIFNCINCRVIDNSLNIFRGFFKNIWFMGILLIMIGGQVLIVSVGGAAFVVKQLPWQGWVISIILGALSLPVAVFARVCVPDHWFKFPKWLPWLEWIKLERKKAPKTEKQSFYGLEDHDVEKYGAISKAIVSKLSLEFKRGGKTNMITRAFRYPLHQKPNNNSMMAAVILPGALASSLGTPSDGRSIRSQSFNAEDRPELS